MSEMSEDCNPAGRPPCLDEEKRRIIIALLTNGSSRRVAAHYVGCSTNTILRTMRRDVKFEEAVLAAEENVEIEALRFLRIAARKDRYWRAAAWLLERKNPRDFSSQSQFALTSDQLANLFTKAISPFIQTMSDEQYEQAFNLLDELVCEANGQPKAPTPTCSTAPYIVEPPIIEPPDGGNFVSFPTKELENFRDDECT